MNPIRFSLLHKAIISIILILLPICFVQAVGYYRGRASLEKLVLDDLTAKGVPYEVSTAFFNEVARWQIEGDIYFRRL